MASAPPTSSARSSATRSASSKEIALEVFEVDRLDFAEAYLVACAEASGVETIASFDRSVDRVATVRRVEPS